MSTEIVIPWMLDEYGNVATTEDPNIQVMQHVKSVVATEPGERVMLPDYGVATREFMFSPGPNKVSAEITRAIDVAMATWEPSVDIINVTPSPTSSQGIAPVEVDFSQDFTPADQTLTAVIQVGGTVVDMGTA